MTEATALLRLQHGREDALAWFIDKYTAYVCTVIRYVIGASMTEEDVEETASDVFLALWERADCVTLATVRPWLGGVARNKAKQKLRQRGLALSLEEDLLALDGPDPEEALEQAVDAIIEWAVNQPDTPNEDDFLDKKFDGAYEFEILRDEDEEEDW